MKFSERWLREWVDPPLDTEGLVQVLTMAGLEVDGYAAVAPPLAGVVVGEITACEPHPDADKLSVCTVRAGAGDDLQIVCGAPNARAGLKAPVALVGATLPGGMNIREAKLRGVASRGMLCSEKELDIGEGAAGLMELDPDAPVGAALAEYLGLNDAVIDVDLTPNRGDCFSLLGIARELGAASGLALSWPELRAVVPAIDDTLEVEVLDPEACPRFCGRIIRGIDPGATTPRWMKEKLKRGGVRPLHPVVDVTNYVMMELGQPVHGFDLATLDGGIRVRKAERGESVVLLDGREIELEPDVLVIADHGGARAIAGIMGGLTSGVGGATVDVFLEVAFFAPAAIAGRARRMGLHTDASLRFERGVDPRGQRRAIERATTLLTAIAGGRPGPVIEVVDESRLPARNPVMLRRDRLEQVLGTRVPDEKVAAILDSLGMQPAPRPEGWSVTPPSWRFDIAIEEDLMEEVARLHGYDEIPESGGAGSARLGRATETRVTLERARALLVDRGYQEVVTYSFVDRAVQEVLYPDHQAIRLANPISSEMSDMRMGLWPGLVAALRQNVSRQQGRVRIFESGLKFNRQANEIKQINVLGGLVAGPRWHEQWAAGNQAADFYDAKADLEALLALTGVPEAFRVEPAHHGALHPGQSARVLRGGEPVGWIGALHPVAISRLDLGISAFVFEIETEIAFEAVVPQYHAISRFPAVRRDLAVIIDEEVAAERLCRAVRDAAGDLLRELRVFDVYRGKGIDSGRKSVALGLILQETSRTLTDDDADRVVSTVISRLERELQARIRD